MHYTDQHDPFALTGTYAARPAPASVVPGTVYNDTTNSALWVCVINSSGVAAWRAIGAGAIVHATTQSGEALTGAWSWDEWDAPTFANVQAVSFTRAGGVLTYTGPGVVVNCLMTGSADINTTDSVRVGFSLNDAAPTVYQTHYFYATQLRPFMAQHRIALATGDTLRLKFSCANARTLTPYPGSAFQVWV